MLIIDRLVVVLQYAQNPLDQFPGSFLVLRVSWR